MAEYRSQNECRMEYTTVIYRRSRDKDFALLLSVLSLRRGKRGSNLGPDIVVGPNISQHSADAAEGKRKE